MMRSALLAALLCAAVPVAVLAQTADELKNDEKTPGDVLTYERRSGAERLIVALNLGEHSQRLELPDWASDWRVLLSTVADTAPAGHGAVLLRTNEGLILMAD